MIRTRAEKNGTAFLTKRRGEVCVGHETRVTKRNRCIRVLKPFSLFFPPRPAWHEDRMSGITRIDLSSARRGMGRHGAAWAATVPRTGNTACEVFHETRPFPFPGRQTFLLERTRPLDHGFHESRDTKHGLCGRCVRRGCARHAQSETPARTVVHAARSLLSCALWGGIGRHGRQIAPGAGVRAPSAAAPAALRAPSAKSKAT